MSPHVIGTLILALPAVAAAWLLLWRSYRPVFWSVLAMIAVAAGYLNATGAARDLGEHVVPWTAPVGTPAR